MHVKAKKRKKAAFRSFQTRRAWGWVGRREEGMCWLMELQLLFKTSLIFLMSESVHSRGEKCLNFLRQISDKDSMTLCFKATLKFPRLGSKTQFPTSPSKSAGIMVLYPHTQLLPFLKTSSWLRELNFTNLLSSSRILAPAVPPEARCVPCKGQISVFWGTVN